MERNHYKDILVIVIGFTLIGMFFSLPWMVYTVVGIGFVCVVSETIAGYVAKGWMVFGRTLGNINAVVLLTLVFVLMVIPLSFLQRIFGKKEERPEHSNWQPVDTAKLDFTKPW